MSKKLLVIGAGFLQTFVIKKAVSMGYETYALDANPNAEGFAYAHKHKIINIIDEKACLEYAREEHIDGVLTAATDYGVLSAAYVAQELGLPGLKYDVAQQIKNKYRARECLFKHHVDDADQAYEVDQKEDIGYLANRLTYPVMVKPCDGSGSRAVSRVDNANDLLKACNDAITASITRRAVIEPFIVGKEYGAESFVYNGKIYVLAIMQKWMTEPPYYAELGHAIPANLSLEVEEKAKHYIKKAIQALGVNYGAVNMDMIITEKNDIHIVDVGARMGGNLIGSHIVPYGTGIDYLSCLINSAVGNSLNFDRSEHWPICSKLLALKGGVVKRLPNFRVLEEEYGVEIVHHLHVGDVVNEYHTNLDGCGYIIVKKDSINEAIATSDTVLKIINDYVF